MSIIMNSAAALFFLVSSMISPVQYPLGLNHGDEARHAREIIGELVRLPGLELEQERVERSVDSAHIVQIYRLGFEDPHQEGYTIELFLFLDRLEMIRFSGVADAAELADIRDEMDFMLHRHGFSSVWNAGTGPGGPRWYRSEDVAVALWTKNGREENLLFFEPRASRAAIHLWGRTLASHGWMPADLEDAILQE